MISDPIVTVECDRCGETEEFHLTPLAKSGSWDDRNVEKTLSRWGWRIDGPDTHICPDCAKEESDRQDSDNYSP